ncbi:uncharacterized protein [Anabrus simplex]
MTEKESEMANKGTTYAMECMQETEADIDTCMKTLVDPIDCADETFMKCNCMVSCINKKMGTMNEAGQFDKEAMEKMKSDVTNERAQEAGSIIIEQCMSAVETKTDCDAGCAMRECAKEKSSLVNETCHAVYNMFG